MKTLFDATRPVKTSRSFGKGLLRSLPTARTNHTADDAAAWAAESNRGTDSLNARVDELHAEREAIRMLEAGLATW